MCPLPLIGMQRGGLPHRVPPPPHRRVFYTAEYGDGAQLKLQGGLEPQRAVR